jgi:hypothetical protein
VPIREPPKGTYPTADEIAERSYEMFLERLSSPLGLHDYWRLAEAELLERAARRIPRIDDRRDRPQKR